MEMTVPRGCATGKEPIRRPTRLPPLSPARRPGHRDRNGTARRACHKRQTRSAADFAPCGPRSSLPHRLLPNKNRYANCISCDVAYLDSRNASGPRDEKLIKGPESAVRRRSVRRHPLGVGATTAATTARRARAVRVVSGTTVSDGREPHLQQASFAQFARGDYPADKTHNVATRCFALHRKSYCGKTIESGRGSGRRALSSDARVYADLQNYKLCENNEKKVRGIPYLSS